MSVDEIPKEFLVMDSLIEMEEPIQDILESLVQDVGEDGLSYDKPIILTWQFESLPGLGFTLIVKPLPPDLVDYFTGDTVH